MSLELERAVYLVAVLFFCFGLLALNVAIKQLHINKLEKEIDGLKHPEKEV